MTRRELNHRSGTGKGFPHQIRAKDYNKKKNEKKLGFHLLSEFTF
jgi:hypothetical protein